MTNTKQENDIEKNNKRLQEIFAMKFGELADEEILELLEERKRLTELNREYDKLRKEEEERLQKEQEHLQKEKEEKERLRKEGEERLRKEEEKRLALEKEQRERQVAIEKQKRTLAKEIERLNKAISPDKEDEELLALIAERKRVEKELKNVEEVLGADISKDTLDEKEDVKVKTEEKTEPEKKTEPEPSFRESLKKEFGEEEIGEDFPEGGELHRYLTQLKNNTGSLGTLLQEMPADAKKNKAFMLQVAEIDPAYAMHYADNELKKDENFNIKVAFMKNPRNSGNALAEMLPEARTSRVVLAAVKQDYRNVKFIQPNMEDYDEIMRIAKKATLEKLQSLKSAADMLLLIPRPLQQDRQFMAEAKNIMGENKRRDGA